MSNTKFISLDYMMAIDVDQLSNAKLMNCDILFLQFYLKNLFPILFDGRMKNTSRLLSF